MIRMIWQRRMIYFFYLWMILKELYNLLCIFCMALKTERQSFNPLKKEECVEWTDCCTCIAKKNCTDESNKSSRTYSIIERNSMITWVWSCNVRILSTLLPVELSAFYDDTTESCSVTADELCS